MTLVAEDRSTIVDAGGPGASALRVNHGEPIDLATTTALWPELAERAVVDNPFFDPVFLGPASEALSQPIEVLALRRNGHLTGFMPLTAGRLGRVAPVLIAWAHQYGPLGAPVVADDDFQATMEGLIGTAFDRAGDSRALIFPYAPVGPISAAIEAAATSAGRTVTHLDGHIRAALDRNADGIDPRPLLPKKRRKEYARLLRRLGELGPVVTEHAVTQADIKDRLEEFLALEASGWKGWSGTAMLNRPAIAGFARRAIENLATRGHSSILSLRVGDRPAAILICLHQHRTAMTWKIAIDEVFAAFSPGALLMLEAPLALFANPGIELIDSCAEPDHPMIDHLWRGRLRLETLAIGPAHSRTLYRVGLAVHRTESALRRSVRSHRRSPRKSGQRTN